MSGPGQRSLLHRIATAIRVGWSDKRQMLGLLALAMLIGGVSIYVAGVVAASFTSLSGPLLRAGLVLGALWLAWPQLGRLVTRIPQWLAVGFAVILFVGIIRPRFLFVIVPLALVLWFLGPVLARKFTGGPGPQPRPRPTKIKAREKSAD